MRIGHSGMRRAVVWGSAAALAGSALVGCTGQDPEAPSVSDEPIESLETPTMSNSPGESDSALETMDSVLLEGLGAVLERETTVTDAYAGGAGAGSGSVQHSVGSDNVSEDDAVVEARLYCTPVGAAAAVEFNQEPATIGCMGADAPVVLESDAAAARDAQMVKLEIVPEDPADGMVWAAVFEAK